MQYSLLWLEPNHHRKARHGNDPGCMACDRLPSPTHVAAGLPARRLRQPFQPVHGILGASDLPVLPG